MINPRLKPRQKARLNLSALSGLLMKVAPMALIVSIHMSQ